MHTTPPASRLRLGCLVGALLLLGHGAAAEPRVGAAIERDAVLRALTDNADTEEGAARRIRLFEAVFGPRDAYAATVAVGAPLPTAWLEAVIAHGAMPVITVEEQPGVDWRPTVERLSTALAGLDCEAWVSLFPLRAEGSIGATVARQEEAAAVVRRLAPRTVLIRAVDTRAASSAEDLWRQGSGYDVCGIEIAVGHTECQGARDVGTELASVLAARPGAAPVAITRLSVAHECGGCKSRFPEAAANRLAGLLGRLRQSPDIGLLVLDSSDTVAHGGALDCGLLASSTVADACRAALPAAPAAGPSPTAVAAPVDPTARWTVAILVFGLLLTLCAVWLAGRLRPTPPRGAFPAEPRGNRWSWAGALFVLAGLALLAYPWLTSLARGARPDGQGPQPTRGWLVAASRAEAASSLCMPPFRLEIPAIELSESVGSDATVENLRDGPMHYTGTALPGEPSNCCIAGHRSTYGAPFRRLLELRPGDEIVLAGAAGGFRRVYQVAWVRAVDAADGRYLAPTPTEALTLSTCHPFGLASERLMLRAYPGAIGAAAAHSRPLDERFPTGRRRLFARHGLAAGERVAWVELLDLPSRERTPAGIGWAERRGMGGVEPAPSSHWSPPRLLGPADAAREGEGR